MNSDAAAQRYRDALAALAAWVGWVSRHAGAVLAVSVVVSIAATAYFALNLKINTSTTDMLAKDVPFRQYARELDAAFPQSQDTLVVVIEGQTAGLADDTALTLGQRLRELPAVFDDVYDLRGHTFFRENGLLYLDTEELYELSDTLAEVQPFLGTLWRERNLKGLFHIIGLAADEAAKAGGDEPLPLAPVFGAMTDVAAAQQAGRSLVLSWSRILAGKPGEPEPISERRRFIIVKPKLNFASLQPADDAMDTIRELAAEMNIDPEHGLRLRLTGSAALEQEELASVETGMGLAAVISLVLVLVILLAGLGSVRLVAATLLTLIVGLVWTAAYALLGVGSLNLISVAFAVLFIGLSVDFGIHFGLRYRESTTDGVSPEAALRRAALGVGGPLTLCAVSAAIAFFAFLPTDYVGLAELGVIAGGGMFIALFANLTVLPAAIALFPPKPAPPKPEKARDVAAGPGMSAGMSTGMAKLICIASALVTVVCLVLVPRAAFDFDPLNLKDPHTESVSTLLDLMEGNARNHYSAEVLMPNLAAADAQAAALEILPEVDHVLTLSKFVPTDQDEKLQIIGDMGLFLGPSLMAAMNSDTLDDGERHAAWEGLRPRLVRLAAGQGTLVAAAQRLVQALDAVFAAKDGAELERRLLHGLGGRLESLKTTLRAQPVTLESLPKSLRQRWQSTDGRARAEVYASADLRQREPLESFVTAVRALAPKLSGTPVTIMEAGRTVLGAFMLAGAIAAVGICLLLALVTRRARDVALVFLPVVLAGVWTVGASVIGGLAFNLANVIVLPLLFGLGVAGAIHLVARAHSAGGGSAAMRTSTPRAVALSALTTIGSFGSISLSAHPGTASMGILLMIAISMTMLATLVFLPALMRLLAREG
ncbi:MAG: MMPL family transporter [Rhodospirillaceae bacterium]|nr:MMPL family transporter [Rhodospirillaceae bacterium]